MIHVPSILIQVLCGNDKCIRNVSLSMTLKEALSSLRFVTYSNLFVIYDFLFRPTIEGGTPTFMILAKNTTFRDHFLSQHSVTV